MDQSRSPLRIATNKQNDGYVDPSLIHTRFADDYNQGSVQEYETYQPLETLNQSMVDQSHLKMNTILSRYQSHSKALRPTKFFSTISEAHKNKMFIFNRYFSWKNLEFKIKYKYENIVCKIRIHFCF